MYNSKFKFTNIAHKNHVFCSPINSLKLDTLLKILDLNSDSKVIDIGSGKSEILIRLVELYNVNAVGIDLNSLWLNEARNKAKNRIPEEKLLLHEMDIKEFSYEPNSFDLSICIGSKHAYGSFLNALEEMKKLVKKGGYLLLADLYLKKEPPQGYIDFLGADSLEFNKLHDLITKATESGVIPLYTCVSNNDDFDHYEGLYKFSIEKYLKENSEDPDNSMMKDKIRKWNNAYYEWGRDTLGFSMFLFQV